ncbi:MAG TPA: response regulator transcription factor [Chryseosolibacter sp.]
MNSLKRRVIVIEADTKLRILITSLIEMSGKFLLINDYATCEEALKNLKLDGPDIIVMNLDYAGMKGIDAIRSFKKALMRVDILVVASYQETEIALGALSAGANGYILSSQLDTITAELDDIASGGSPLNSLIARKIIENLQVTHFSPISDRETEVLRLLIKGNTHTKVASHLNISSETAKTHIKNIYRKLKVNSRSEAVRKALEDRIISLSSIDSHATRKYHR